MKTVLLVVTVICVWVIFSASVFAGSYTQHRPPVGLAVLDALVIRPISAGVSAGLTGFCVATMPLAYAIGLGEPSARLLVQAPWRFTAMRPLGDFENYKDGKPITVIDE